MARLSAILQKLPLPRLFEQIANALGIIASNAMNTSISRNSSSWSHPKRNAEALENFSAGIGRSSQIEIVSRAA
jgi:hypothetical protein